MTRTVASFDVFDTLIARRCGEPRAVFDLLEARAGIPGLAAARLRADRALGGRGAPYLLADIWREAGSSLGLEPAASAALAERELEIEREQAVPIAENLNRVRDGDLLVSDTYLPADAVLSLLRAVGLDREVGLAVSNDGKHRGWIWPQLLRRAAIREHTGDNEHSDGRTAAAAGIRAVVYTGARPTPVEALLAGRGWKSLAALAREVRLANPHADPGDPRRRLWNLACGLNLPLLLFAGLWLERQAEAAGARELFFVSRDGLLWQRLHRKFFPHRKSTYLYASRKCLLAPSDDYLDYFRSAWHPGGLIVDLFSTGHSWTRFFRRLGTRGRLRCIGRVDDYAYAADPARPEEWLDFAAAFRNGELGSPVNKGVEMLNYAPHSGVEDVRALPGGSFLPVLAPAPEYDPALPAAVHAAFRLAAEKADRHPGLLPGPDDDRAKGADALIPEFVRMICADRNLPAIYPGHRAADEAYLRSLRELGG